jgi:hypothetical protein
VLDADDSDATGTTLRTEASLHSRFSEYICLEDRIFLLQLLAMSFFNRGSTPPATGQRASPSPYTRLPDVSQPHLPPRNVRPPPSRYDDPSGFEKRSVDQRRPPPPSGGLYVRQSLHRQGLSANTNTALPYKLAQVILWPLQIVLSYTLRTSKMGNMFLSRTTFR